MFRSVNRGSVSIVWVGAAALLTVAAAAILGACSGDDADDAMDDAGDAGVTVDDARADFADDGAVAVYMDLTGGRSDDKVVAVSSSLADEVHIHEVWMDAGSQRMGEREGAIAVPAGAEVVLEPGDSHLMMLDVGEAPEVGSSFKMTLEFDSGESRDIDVRVARTGLTDVGLHHQMDGAEVAVENARADFQDDGTAAVYMDLTGGGSDAEIVAASSSLADEVHIHEVWVEDGSQQMGEREGTIKVPAGASVELGPGDSHLMMFDVGEAPEVESSFGMTLEFGSGESMDIDVDVSQTGLTGVGLHHGEAMDGAGVSIDDARAEFANNGDVAVYMDLTGGRSDAEVVAASSSLADEVHIHEVWIDEGAQTMGEKEGTIKVPAGARVVLEPGDSHLMMFGVGEVPEVGSSFGMMLEFGSGESMDVDVEVERTGLSSVDVGFHHQ